MEESDDSPGAEEPYGLTAASGRVRERNICVYITLLVLHSYGRTNGTGP